MSLRIKGILAVALGGRLPVARQLLPCRGASSQDVPRPSAWEPVLPTSCLLPEKNRRVLCHPGPMAARLTWLRPQTPLTPIQYCFSGRRSKKFKKAQAGQAEGQGGGAGLGWAG